MNAPTYHKVNFEIETITDVFEDADGNNFDAEIEVEMLVDKNGDGKVFGIQIKKGSGKIHRDDISWMLSTRYRDNVYFDLDELLKD